MKTEEMNEGKGAFKDFPRKLQPMRIPLEKFEKLAEEVRRLLSPHGKIFIPDAVKKSIGKKSTGDLDVFFLPKERNVWRDVVKRNIPGIIAEQPNGPQLMLVVKGLIDKNQYMIDIILSNEKEWEFVQFHHGHGAILPVIIGSFARSLGYKFSRDGLYRRMKDPKGNFHNLLLTHDPKIALQILGLKSEVDAETFYRPETISQWVIESTRFDSVMWKSGPSADGRTINVKNHKSHRAAVKKPEVQLAYALVEKSDKRSSIPNNFEVERQLLGDKYVDDMLTEMNRIKEKEEPVLNGKEIMQLLNISPGPEVGQWVKFLANKPDVQSKDQAKQLILQMNRSPKQ